MFEIGRSVVGLHLNLRDTGHFVRKRSAVVANDREDMFGRGFHSPSRQNRVGVGAA